MELATFLYHLISISDVEPLFFSYSTPVSIVESWKHTVFPIILCWSALLDYTSCDLSAIKKTGRLCPPDYNYCPKSPARFLPYPSSFFAKFKPMPCKQAELLLLPGPPSPTTHPEPEVAGRLLVCTVYTNAPTRLTRDGAAGYKSRKLIFFFPPDDQASVYHL